MYKYYNFLLKKVSSILTSYTSKNIFISSLPTSINTSYIMDLSSNGISNQRSTTNRNFPNGERIVLNLSQFYDDLFKLILKTNN